MVFIFFIGFIIGLIWYYGLLLGLLGFIVYLWLIMGIVLLFIGFILELRLAVGAVLILRFAVGTRLAVGVDYVFIMGIVLILLETRRTFLGGPAGRHIANPWILSGNVFQGAFLGL